jgi:hypothetical protein
MTSRLEEIARRKQELSAKAAGERAELARIYGGIKSPLSIGPRLAGIGRALKTHPIIAVGLSSFLVSGYGGKLLKSTTGVFKVWHLARPLWGWWRKRRGKR